LTIVNTAILGLLALGSCATNPTRGNASPRVSVVASSATWGAIASQLSAGVIDVHSIITSPSVDPHEYEPTPADARSIDHAKVVILNGLGYDTWASRIVQADPRSGRTVIDAGAVLGRRRGDNPHRWYDPRDVVTIADAISAAFMAADRSHAADFAAARQGLDDSLSEYRSLVASIRADFAGTSIGASESVITPLADALGLVVSTPDRFLNDISEGIDPAPSDTETIARQIRSRSIAVYVYNSQNASPDVERQVEASHAVGIEVVTVTESLPVHQSSFADWQVSQLRALRSALARSRAPR
jgi:zinc/manganese transport system substrate-binding protein